MTEFAESINFEKKYTMTFFTQDFLQFFIDLAPNNNKDWFDVNRKRYEASVKDPFRKFVQHLINEITKIDPSFKDLEPKDCVFRINRDIRFSKDKTPYKMNVSAVIAPEGKKSRAVNGIYFELGPEHVRVYGGIYEIDKEDLQKVREGIASHPKKFNQAITDPLFLEMFQGKIHGEKNKVIPKELKEAASKEALIFNKQWYFYAEFESELVLSEDLDRIFIQCFRAGRPVENFFNELISRR
jgi:uncharacterized protein (TIGR02453 family)